MTRARAGGRPARPLVRAAALAALATLATMLTIATLPAPAHAQDPGTELGVSITGPPGDTLRTVTPTFVIKARNLGAAPGPVTLNLQIGRQAQFASGVLVDTTVTVPLGAPEATIALPRPLPSRLTIFWRARVRPGDGREAVSPIEGPRVSAPWVTLLSPNDPLGRSLQERRPQFVWRAAQVSTPPGPWRFRIQVRNASTDAPVLDRAVSDTVYRPTFDLESNTSYRWSVTASLTTGVDSLRVNGAGSFVIVDERVPRATLLYQNFPNPFPNVSSAVTCIWFDLRTESSVNIDVFDLRGFHVRRIAPGPAGAQVLPAGRYGRFGPGNDSGCDPQYQWDGRDDGGRFVPAGVYLLRLRADRTESFKKVVFRGR